MVRIRRALALGAAVALSFAARAGNNDVQTIRALIDKYTASIDGADTALASEVWSTSPEVSFIHPLGHEHGFDEVKQNVYGRIMGGMFSERKLTAHDPAIHVYGDAAWAEFDWDFAAKRRSNGAPVRTSGRETQIYHREGDRWRLVHVHYSAPVVAPKVSSRSER